MGGADSSDDDNNTSSDSDEERYITLYYTMVVQYTGPGRRSPTIYGQGVGTCRGVGKVAVHGTCTLYASPHHTPLSTRTTHAQGGVTVPYSGKLSSKKFAEKTFVDCFAPPLMCGCGCR